MSWSVQRTGTKAAVSKAIGEDFDKAAANYKGQEEEQDVLAAKARVLAAIADIDVTADVYASTYGVRVTASGSRSKFSTTINVDVQRVALTLD